MAKSASGTHESHHHGLRDQPREGAFVAVMQGSGETYVSAFALLLHANAFQIGLLSAVPQIVGTCSQLISVKILDRLQNRRSLILTGALGQALSCLPLFLLPLLVPSQASWLLLAATVIYFAMGNLTIPAWNSLITDVVDADARGAYFAHRAKIIAATSFAALAAAGLILHVSEAWQHPAAGFAVIFLIAAIARLISTSYLARLPERKGNVSAIKLGLVEFLRHERSEMFRRFLLFSGSFYAAAMIAGPFFVVYLLRDLHLTYLEYALWLSAPIVGQLVSLREWGRIADTFGNKKVLVVTGMAIPILPMLYLCSANWFVLVIINFVSGLMWPGFSLSLQNYVFDVVPPDDRAKGVAVYNTVNAAGAGAGALLGGCLALVAPSHMLLLGLAIPLVSNLPIVFFVSGILRLAVSLTLLRTLREGRTVTPISHRKLVRELPLIKPLATALSLRTMRFW